MPLVSMSYYGGKNRQTLQDAILSRLMPNHGYLEPFCGSASILLNRPRVRCEVVNDVDGLLVNFFRVLRDCPEELVEALTLTPYARDEYDDCIQKLLASKPLGDVECARCWYAVAGMSGRSRWGSAFLPDTIRGAEQNAPKGSRFANRIRDELPLVAERLRAVTIENRDAVDLVRKYSDPHWTIYCDPPYPADSRTAPSAQYTHDTSDDLHNRLLDAVLESKAQVVISTYESELYAGRLAGWERHEVVVQKTSSDGPEVGRELIYANRLPQASLF